VDNKNLISNLSHLELNNLYNIAGYIIASYIITSITEICTTCDKCIQLVRLPIPVRFFIYKTCTTKMLYNTFFMFC